MDQSEFSDYIRGMYKKYKKKIKKTRVYTRAIADVHDCKTGKNKVLFWRGKGSKKCLLFESNLAKFFMRKKLQVEFAVCDGILPVCINRTYLRDEKKQPSVKIRAKNCAECYGYSKSILSWSKMKTHFLSKWIVPTEASDIRQIADTMDIADIVNYEVKNVPVGDISVIAALRYFRSAKSIEDIHNPEDEYVEKIFRDFFYSTLVCCSVSDKALDEIKPNYVFAFRGVYELWAPMVYNAIARDIPVMCWTYGYWSDSAYMRRNTKDDLDQVYAPGNKHWETVKNKELTVEEKNKLDQFMTKRIFLLGRNKAWRGRFDYKREFFKPDEVLEKLNLSKEKPIWMINTGMNWDWDVYKESRSIFKGPVDWLIKTFDLVRQNTNVSWILRTHPEETLTNTAKGCMNIILDKFGSIPDHIRLITAKDSISSYSMLNVVNGCLTLQGTIGIEASLMGVPVVVGDAGFYGYRGFTIEADNIDEYNKLIMNIQDIGPLSEEKIKIAERYAYDFWLYRQIPFRREEYQQLKNNHLFQTLYEQMINGEQFGFPADFKNLEFASVEDIDHLDWKRRLRDCDIQ